MNKTLSIAALGLSLALVACGGMSKKDAKKGWEATQSAATTGQMQASQALTEDESFSFSYSCAQGGDLKFTLSGTGDESSYIFGYKLDFLGCVNDGIKIDGDLTWQYKIEGNENSGTFAYIWKGFVVYDGDVVGECEVDMKAEFGYGTGGLFGVSYTYEGTICGHNASSVL